MKSKDFQIVVKNKFENSDGPAKFFRNLGGVISKQAINMWIKMIKGTESINLFEGSQSSEHNSDKN